MQDDMYRWDKLGRADLNHNYITDAVVGSLPHGLSLDDRRHVLEKTPASPLVQSLQSVSEVRCLLPYLTDVHCIPRGTAGR